MKQALNILIAYLTCTDPIIQNKWLNLLHSFWHKDDGWLIKAMAVDAAGYKITVVDSDGNDVEHIISIPTIPISQEINYINGLQNALDTKVDKSAGKGLSTNDFTTALKAKLDGLSNYVHPTFHQISEIENLQTALDDKVTVVAGKGLSTEDFTASLKNKLDALKVKVTEYGLTGVIDGVNDTFTTSQNFQTGSTKIFLNGIRQFLGDDYTESASNTIVFVVPPIADDKIIADFNKE